MVLLKNKISERIENLEKDLDKRRKERFYFSPGANREYTEEEALENNFICPETGEVLELKENSKTIDQLDIEISKLKILIEDVSVEIINLEKQENKARERKIKIEAKKKEEERKARKEKLKEKRKLEEKTSKPRKKEKKKGKKKSKSKTSKPRKKEKKKPVKKKAPKRSKKKK